MWFMANVMSIVALSHVNQDSDSQYYVIFYSVSAWMDYWLLNCI